MVGRLARKHQFLVKPKKSEGFAMCDALHDGKCTCRMKGRRWPCSSLVWPLQNAFGSGAKAAEIDREKMLFNRENGTFYTKFTGKLQDGFYPGPCRPRKQDA